ncbi:hypothetical protein DN31_3045 [Vibrio mimicus]|nr:hypothetical protein DN31_3045 [Vibrio mimicus]
MVSFSLSVVIGTQPYKNVNKKRYKLKVVHIITISIMTQSLLQMPNAPRMEKELSSASTQELSNKRQLLITLTSCERF